MARPGAVSDSAIAFERVTLRYPGGREVLREASFALPTGAFRFLTGVSGAGKSTLLGLVTMALRPSQGVVRLFGQEVTRASAESRTRLRRRMGLVFQDFWLIDELSVYDNVALPLRVRAAREASYRAEVRELLDWVGLGDRLDARPATLSGGEKQRVAIARAVIARPELVVADEPTGSVDPQMARRILHLLVELNRSGTSVLVATHDAAIMDQLGAPRLTLAKGRVTPEGARR